ncbi:protein Z, vitamin K-dependent plasma glycoprotein b [Polypterus senegalus]|uniref:protein Z, vitamin K-dependent plasma glycoprotein b n=1 Tax=Polypterus senegalus TaxID=55291 RepID=UPI0019652599|nr:protein Z, vitamin K-dependent plasma glycoprotein b [Polypterus senegalus]XP_039600574.1 protein Z, vitamin K-dependent plasma glycoprotein b [Polypterus senegalus]
MISLIWILSIFSLALLAFIEANENVFLPRESASKILHRHRRANRYLLEEILQGNIERECFEEVCSYEEAREYFEDDTKTKKFWLAYKDIDQCKSNPCQNGGTCIDKTGEFVCKCKEGFQGRVCEVDIAECHASYSGCEHFCSLNMYNIYVCSCANGYVLNSNEKSCVPQVEYPCGKLKSPGYSGTKPKSKECEEGECPWQALLVNETNETFCNGVIIGQYYILTTAKCVLMYDTFHIIVGKHETNGTKRQTLLTDNIFVHPKHSNNREDNDLAVIRLKTPVHFTKNAIPICIPEKDFAENVLMLGNVGVFSSWVISKENKESLMSTRVPYLDLETCQGFHNITITNKMFCTGENLDTTCMSSNGSPIYTDYQGTRFLTGILTTGPGDYDCNRHYVFMKISRYVTWLNSLLKLL